MAKTELMVLFKKMQRDDKKDVLKFEYRGKEDDERINIPQSVYGLVGEMVNIEVEGCNCGPITAELAKANKDSKKVVLDLSLRGDSGEKAIDLYRKAGQDVKLSIEPSQASLVEDEPKNDHEGVEYAVDVTTGNVLSFNERKKAEEEAAAATEETPEEEWDEEEAKKVDPDQLEDDELPF
jgi:hypothetical protein